MWISEVVSFPLYVLVLALCMGFVVCSLEKLLLMLHRFQLIWLVHLVIALFWFYLLFFVKLVHLVHYCSFGSLLFIWFNSDRYASQVSTHIGFNFTGHGSCKIRRTFLVLSFVFCFPIWMLSSFDTIVCFNLHSYFDNYHKGKSCPIIQAPSTPFFGYLHR